MKLDVILCVVQNKESNTFSENVVTKQILQTIWTGQWQRGNQPAKQSLQGLAELYSS